MKSETLIKANDLSKLILAKMNEIDVIKSVHDTFSRGGVVLVGMKSVPSSISVPKGISEAILNKIELELADELTALQAQFDAL